MARDEQSGEGGLQTRSLARSLARTRFPSRLHARLYPRDTNGFARLAPKARKMGRGLLHLPQRIHAYTHICIDLPATISTAVCTRDHPREMRVRLERVIKSTEFNNYHAVDPIDRGTSVIVSGLEKNSNAR